MEEKNHKDVSLVVNNTADKEQHGKILNEYKVGKKKSIRTLHHSAQLQK